MYTGFYHLLNRAGRLIYLVFLYEFMSYKSVIIRDIMVKCFTLEIIELTKKFPLVHMFLTTMLIHA